jgi:hypothetical protein
MGVSPIPWDWFRNDSGPGLEKSNATKKNQHVVGVFPLGVPVMVTSQCFGHIAMGIK